MCRCRRRAWSIKGLTSDPALRVPRVQLVEFLLAVIGNDSMGRLAESFLVTGVGTIPRHETGTRRIRGRRA